LRGAISGLERGTTAAGAVFEALLARVTRLFAYDPAELRRTHLSVNDRACYRQGSYWAPHKTRIFQVCVL